jgi:enoyl-CoA hydratase
MTERPESVGREVLWEVVDGHIGVARLNRPERRNAVNGDVAAALDWIVKTADADPDIRACILTSSTPGFFCAGADLSEISKGRGHLLRSKDGGFAGFVQQKRQTPWIAAVVGAGLAGGCELALACDMIVASDDARFGLPEVKRGLYAGAGGVFRLTRRLPASVAYEMIATGDPIDAPRLHALGLVNRCVPADAVLDEAVALAKAIAVNAPMSVAESLRVARMSFDMTEDELWPLNAEVSAKVFSSEDAREGPVAFLEKRTPVWKGR